MKEPIPQTPNRFVAIFGGAVSGAEAASQLAEKGFKVVVFDQNALPYGKIEDGLPKWHHKLRDKEEQKINEKLSHPLVSYVPNIRLGSDLSVTEIARDWGFSAVLLAVGAWRDRPLPIEGIDEYIHQGLYYQNPFIYWYNHRHEPNYQGIVYDTPDDAIIVGGGLASLDVAKVLMFDNVEKALRARGIETNLFELDRSIAKVLEKHQLTLDDLGIKGCTLYYRRRIKDMPLSTMATDTPEQLEKAEKTREKILNNYQSKYLFNIAPNHAPVDKIVENGRLMGLVFQETEFKDGRLVNIEGALKEVRGSVVISSIGSIPESIQGIPMDGQVYKIIYEECCKVDGFQNVFALGNAVTGRGNINESSKHGKEITEQIVEKYLSQEGESAMYKEVFEDRESQISFHTNKIMDKISLTKPLSIEQMQELDQKVSELQQKVGYTGTFQQWVDKHLPLRLEEMIDLEH
ncbi:MAG: FAD-dependent oxidoreductase [Microscillaceae bacterium]|nr:FAD-dependent oxidoreductase [Microscillaceae bacterium]